jgi:hypothetical protein
LRYNILDNLWGDKMSFKSIRFPEEFIENAKDFADKDFRSIPQQIMYWAEIGKQNELRNWQLEKMRLGLQQAKNNNVASNQEVLRAFTKCHKKAI